MPVKHKHNMKVMVLMVVVIAFLSSTAWQMAILGRNTEDIT